jgi:hypothetical protein
VDNLVVGDAGLGTPGYRSTQVFAATLKFVQARAGREPTGDDDNNLDESSSSAAPALSSLTIKKASRLQAAPPLWVSSKPQQTLPSLSARADLLEVHGEMTTNSSSSGEKDAYPCDYGGGAITVECTWAKICNGDSEGSCTGKSEGLSNYDNPRDNLYASIRACNLRYVGYVRLLSCTVHAILGMEGM